MQVRYDPYDLLGYVAILCLYRFISLFPESISETTPTIGVGLAPSTRALQYMSRFQYLATLTCYSRMENTERLAH